MWRKDERWDGLGFSFSVFQRFPCRGEAGAQDGILLGVIFPCESGPSVYRFLAWISTLTNSPNAGDGIPWCFFCPAPPLRSWLPL